MEEYRRRNEARDEARNEAADAAGTVVDGGGGVTLSELVVVIAYVQDWAWSSRLGEKLGSN